MGQAHCSLILYSLSVHGSPKRSFGDLPNDFYPNSAPLIGLLLNDVAEGVGFEPTTLSGNGFQDRRLRPLGHPSYFYVGARAMLALLRFSDAPTPLTVALA